MSKTNLNKRLVNPNLWLILALFLVVTWEVYLLYSLFAENFTGELPAPLPGAIVRLDLSSYNNTLTLLESNQNFVAKPINLTSPNPFK